MPMFFSLAAVIIDGTNLMVHRRSLQNAADASALAMAQNVDVSAGTCDATCAAIGQQYAQKNGVDVTATSPVWHGAGR